MNTIAAIHAKVRVHRFRLSRFALGHRGTFLMGAGFTAVALLALALLRGKTAAAARE